MRIVRKLQPLSNTCKLFYGHKSMRNAKVYLPVGSFEDHNDLPVILDTMLALDIACRAAEYCEGLVAWPIGYGYSPFHKWSVSLEPSLLGKLVSTAIDGLYAAGAKLVIVVDGHYGHKEIVSKAATRARYVNVWDLLREYGIKSFEEQLEFENKYAAHISERNDTINMLLERAARMLCSL